MYRKVYKQLEQATCMYKCILNCKNTNQKILDYNQTWGLNGNGLLHLTKSSHGYQVLSSKLGNGIKNSKDSYLACALEKSAKMLGNMRWSTQWKILTTVQYFITLWRCARFVWGLLHFFLFCRFRAWVHFCWGKQGGKIQVSAFKHGHGVKIPHACYIQIEGMLINAYG